MGSPVETDVDVLVVGAGPVGLTLANELARRSGITLKIVDAKDAQSKYSKAMAVQSRSLEIYDDLGIAQEAEEKGFIMDGVILYGGKGRMLPITINSKTVSKKEYENICFPTLCLLALSEHFLVMFFRFVISIYCNRTTQLLTLEC